MAYNLGSLISVSIVWLLFDFPILYFFLYHEVLEKVLMLIYICCICCICIYTYICIYIYIVYVVLYLSRCFCTVLKGYGSGLLVMVNDNWTWTKWHVRDVKMGCVSLELDNLLFLLTMRLLMSYMNAIYILGSHTVKQIHFN